MNAKKSGETGFLNEEKKENKTCYLWCWEINNWWYVKVFYILVSDFV